MSSTQENSPDGGTKGLQGKAFREEVPENHIIGIPDFRIQWIAGAKSTEVFDSEICSFEELAQVCMVHRVSESKDGPGFLPARYLDKAARTKENAGLIQVIALDIEGPTNKTEGGQYYLTGSAAPPMKEVAKRIQSLGLKAALATSWNHKAPDFKTGGDIGPRYRILFDPSHPVHPDDYQSVCEGIAKQLGIEEFVDYSGVDRNRLFYFPSAPENRFSLAEQAWVDGAKVSVPEHAGREIYRRREQGAHSGKLNPWVRAYCEATDIRQVLIDNGYREGTTDNRFVRPGGDGGGVVVLGEDDPDTCPVVYTHHSNDQIPQGLALNAFDLKVLFEHRNDRVAAFEDLKQSKRMQIEVRSLLKSVFADEEPNNTEAPQPKATGFLSTEVQFSGRGEPIEYVVDGFIEAGVAMLGGRPGGGKTSATVPLALVVAGVHKVDGVTAEIRRKVVVLSEHPSQIGRALESILRAHPEINRDEAKQWFRVFPSKRMGASELARTLRVIGEAFAYRDAKGFLVRPWVILDTASANLDLLNENDNAQVAEFVGVLKSVHLPILVIAHTPKALKRADIESLTVRGGGAWEGDAHQILFLFEDEAIEQRVIGISKVRFLPAFWEVHIGLSDPIEEFVDVPWDGSAQRLTYVHGVLAVGNREDRAAAGAELQAARREEREAEAVLERANLIFARVSQAVGAGQWFSVTDAQSIGGDKNIGGQALHRLLQGDDSRLITAEAPSTPGKRGPKPMAVLPRGIDPELFFERASRVVS